MTYTVFTTLDFRTCRGATPRTTSSSRFILLRFIRVSLILSASVAELQVLLLLPSDSLAYALGELVCVFEYEGIFGGRREVHPWRLPAICSTAFGTVFRLIVGTSLEISVSTVFSMASDRRDAFSSSKVMAELSAESDVLPIHNAGDKWTSLHSMVDGSSGLFTSTSSFSSEPTTCSFSLILLLSVSTFFLYRPNSWRVIKNVANAIEAVTQVLIGFPPFISRHKVFFYDAESVSAIQSPGLKIKSTTLQKVVAVTNNWLDLYYAIYEMYHVPFEKYNVGYFFDDTFFGLIPFTLYVKTTFRHDFSPCNNLPFTGIRNSVLLRQYVSCC